MFQRVLQRCSLCVVSVMWITSCSRSPSDVWQDSKSAGRHMGRGVQTLGGKHGESRQVASREEFEGKGSVPKGPSDFVALGDAPTQLEVSDCIAQSSISPGESSAGVNGVQIPGIQDFQDPQSNPRWASIFQHVHFDYNSSLVKKDRNVEVVQKIAEYMIAHPEIYIFIEGHCDKRGPTAYNYALGANRSNSVRNILIKEGVHPDHIFTVSYGKDKLLIDEDNEEAHSKNRRCQFKIFVI